MNGSPVSRDRRSVSFRGWRLTLASSPVLSSCRSSSLSESARSQCSLHGHSDVYVAKYLPIGSRTPSPEEIIARRIARDLKIPTAAAIDRAAPEMAALIDGPCWLVPVPASNGSITANLMLTRAIAKLVPGSRVKCAIARAHPVESSSQRRIRGMFGLTVEQHAIVRTAGPFLFLPLYFVDNVITTGTTILACRRALGWGISLAYADASTQFHCAHTTVRMDYRLALAGRRLSFAPLSFLSGAFFCPVCAQFIRRPDYELATRGNSRRLPCPHAPDSVGGWNHPAFRVSNVPRPLPASNSLTVTVQSFGKSIATVFYVPHTSLYSRPAVLSRFFAASSCYTTTAIWSGPGHNLITTAKAARAI